MIYSGKSDNSMEADQHKQGMTTYSKQGFELFNTACQYMKGEITIIKESTIDEGLEYIKHLIKFNIENDQLLTENEKEDAEKKVDLMMKFIKENLKNSGKIIPY